MLLSRRFFRDTNRGLSCRYIIANHLDCSVATELKLSITICLYWYKIIFDGLVPFRVSEVKPLSEGSRGFESRRVHQQMQRLGPPFRVAFLVVRTLARKCKKKRHVGSGVPLSVGYPGSASAALEHAGDQA